MRATRTNWTGQGSPAAPVHKFGDYLQQWLRQEAVNLAGGREPALPARGVVYLPPPAASKNLGEVAQLGLDVLLPVHIGLHSVLFEVDGKLKCHFLIPLSAKVFRFIIRL